MLKSPGSYRIRGITFLFRVTDSFGEGGCLWGKTDRRDSSQAEMADLQSTLGYSPKAVTACPGHQEGRPLQILQQLHTSALAHGFGLGIPQADLHFADVGLAQQQHAQAALANAATHRQG